MKKYKVLIDPEAKRDLKEIFLYIALNDSVSYANKLLDSLEKTLYKLEKFPDRGHIPQELRQTGIKRYLEILHRPYRIIYEIDESNVYIHCVLDGRRNIQEILSERLFR